MDLKQAKANGQMVGFFIGEMKKLIINDLSNLEKGYGSRKWAISQRTGIPIDILTVLLKNLKTSNEVELIMIWNDGVPNGSGYCIKGNLN